MIRWIRLNVYHLMSFIPNNNNDNIIIIKLYLEFFTIEFYTYFPLELALAVKLLRLVYNFGIVENHSL